MATTGPDSISGWKNISGYDIYDDKNKKKKQNQKAQNAWQKAPSASATNSTANKSSGGTKSSAVFNSNKSTSSNKTAGVFDSIKLPYEDTVAQKNAQKAADLKRQQEQYNAQKLAEKQAAEAKAAQEKYARDKYIAQMCQKQIDGQLKGTGMQSSNAVRSNPFTSAVPKLNYTPGRQDNTTNREDDVYKNLNSTEEYDIIKNNSIYSQGSLETISNIVKGAVPSNLYISPLQTQTTGIGWYNPEKPKGRTGYGHQLYDVNTGKRLFAVDRHNLGKNKNVPHLNIDYAKNASDHQKTIARNLNHRAIPDELYNRTNSFAKVVDDFKGAGKTMAAVGIVLDAYDIAKVMYDDMNDDDGTIGKETIRQAVGVGGSWMFGAMGSKLGAMGGAAIGTAICPGLGTVIGGYIGGVAGGIAGSFSGDEISEYLVDKFYKE